MENRADIYIADSRKMLEVKDESVSLIVTSPPYWHLKDYGKSNQIGYGQSLHEYLTDIYRVWKEAYRVLKPGRRMVVNIGNQFARAVVYGRYKIIPLHAEFISQCEDIGFDYMGSIIWQKKTTMNTTGGATIMGSYPYPPNGMVELDYEFIALFKKPGKSEKVPKQVKEQSRLTKEEWKTYFQGHWQFGGARQVGHEAMFPLELPKRIIKMFSFVGEIVLDPFMGSGTTAQAALALGRNCIGYEINEDFMPIMQKKLAPGDMLDGLEHDVRFYRRDVSVVLEKIDYKPGIKDAKPVTDGITPKSTRELHRVIRVIDEKTVMLENGLKLGLLGIRVVDKAGAMDYLNDRLLKKQVFFKVDPAFPVQDNQVAAYVYMKNKIFVNTYMIKAGLAIVDDTADFQMKHRFLQLKPTAPTKNKRTNNEGLYGLKAD